MQVGDYVRTDKGEIGKIINYIGEPTDYYFNCYETDLKNSFSDKYITEYDNEIKTSPNIIDLIEVGDVITFKNDNDVYRVACVPDKELALDDFYLEKNFDGETEDICVEQDTMQKCINSIVTKEQFSAMEYRIEE